ALIGANATFNVAPGGPGPFSYKWRFNGNFIPNATSASLMLSNVQASQSGSYEVLVFNPAGVAASSNADLIVILPVAIVQQPQSQNVRLPDLTNPVTANVTFSVIASSATPITYQWRYNGGNVPGATGSGFSLTNVTPSQTGDYTVVIADSYSSVTSSVARLKVYSNVGWRFITMTGNIGTSSNSVGTDVLIFMQSAGEAYIDDISLVPLAGPNAGIHVVT